MAKKQPSQPSKTVSSTLSDSATNETGAVVHTLEVPRLPPPPEDERNRRLFERIVKITYRAVQRIDRTEEDIELLNMLQARYADREGKLA